MERRDAARVAGVPERELGVSRRTVHPPVVVGPLEIEHGILMGAPLAERAIGVRRVPQRARHRVRHPDDGHIPFLVAQRNHVLVPHPPRRKLHDKHRRGDVPLGVAENGPLAGRVLWPAREVVEHLRVRRRAARRTAQLTRQHVVEHRPGPRSVPRVGPRHTAGGRGRLTLCSRCPTHRRLHVVSTVVAVAVVVRCRRGRVLKKRSDFSKFSNFDAKV